MSKDTELKACPFCGGEAKVARHENEVDYETEITYQVECDNIDCILYCGTNSCLETKAEAIAAWNHRPAPDSDAVQRAEALLAHLKQYGKDFDGVSHKILESFDKVIAEIRRLEGDSTKLQQIKDLCENCNGLDDAKEIIYGREMSDEHGCNKCWVEEQAAEITQLKQKLGENEMLFEAISEWNTTEGDRMASIALYALGEIPEPSWLKLKERTE